MSESEIPNSIEMDAVVEPTDSIADGAVRSVDRKSVTVALIQTAIFYGVIGIAAAAGLVYGSIDGWFSDTWLMIAWIGGAGVLLVIVVLSVIYEKVFYARKSYVLTPSGIEITQGVWWRRTTNVPQSRVQHTDVNQGPLQRRFGISDLVIHTAGTEHATVTLSGLSKSVAMQVRDVLIDSQR